MYDRHMQGLDLFPDDWSSCISLICTSFYKNLNNYLKEKYIDVYKKVINLVLLMSVHGLVQVLEIVQGSAKKLVGCDLSIPGINC